MNVGYLLWYEIRSKGSQQVMCESNHIHICPHGLVLPHLQVELLDKHGLNYEDHYVLIKGLWANH